MSPTTSEGHRDDSDGALVHMKSEEQRRLRLRATLRRARAQCGGKRNNERSTSSATPIRIGPRSGAPATRGWRPSRMARIRLPRPARSARSSRRAPPTPCAMPSGCARCPRRLMATWIRHGSRERSRLTGRPLLDVLAISMQYIAGKAPLWEGGLQIAGDASYWRVEGRRTRGRLRFQRLPRDRVEVSREGGQAGATAASLPRLLGGSSAWSGATAATRPAPGAGETVPLCLDPREVP